MAYIMTNKSFNSETRQALIESDQTFQDLNSQTDDLNAWLDSLRGKMRDRRASAQIQHEQIEKENQSSYEKSFQCFNYAVKSFTNMLGKIATLKDDKIDSNFHGLPIIINPDKPETLASIKFQKNPEWNFQIILDGTTSPPSVLTLHIIGAGSFFEVNAGNGVVMRIPNMPDYSVVVPADNYKSQIDEAFGYLIIYLNDQSTNTNK